MKQYTTPEQTAKLIELGFKKPKSIISAMAYMEDFVSEPCLDCERAYSIGELIEMLPENSSRLIRYVATKRAWIINVDVLGKQGRCHKSVYYAELIDVLYDMIIKLKEGGVI